MWILKMMFGIFETHLHKVRYLIHASGIIITSQSKAWNDTIRMAMLIDLILKPYSQRHGHLFLWMDNCGAHKTGPLPDIFSAANVEVGFLPPNMTYILQVLDLAVNGPLKAHIRKLRAERVFKYFQHYKRTYLSEMDKPVNQRVKPPWSPPKPTMKECILDIMNLIANDFTKRSFKAGLKKCFIDTGTALDENGRFKIYEQSSSQGTMKIAPAGTFDTFESGVISEEQIADYIANGEDDDFNEEEEQDNE
jgi:hypothetical protein